MAYLISIFINILFNTKSQRIQYFQSKLSLIVKIILLSKFYREIFQQQLGIMIAYQLKKRVNTLNSYIKNIEKSIDNGNYTDAAFQIVLSKNKINNSILSPYNQQHAQKDALRYRNNKLKQQISEITSQITTLFSEPSFAAKLAKIQDEKTLAKDIPQGLYKEDVNCVDVQHKINLNDVNKLYYQRYHLSTDFNDIILQHFDEYNEQKEQQNKVKEQDIKFSFKNVIKATRRKNFVLVEYDLSSQDHYLMIQCKNIDHSLKIYRAFNFGQMIQKNMHKRKLFYTPQKTLQFDLEYTIQKTNSIRESNHQNQKKNGSQGSRVFIEKNQPKETQLFSKPGATLQNKQIQSYLSTRSRGFTQIKPFSQNAFKPVLIGSDIKPKDFRRKGSEDIRANIRKQSLSSNIVEYHRNQNYLSGQHNNFQNNQSKLNKFKSQNTFEDFEEVAPQIKNLPTGRRIDQIKQKRKDLLEQAQPIVKINNKVVDNKFNWNDQGSFAQLHQQVNQKNYKFQNKRPQRININNGIEELDEQKNSKSSYREQNYQKADSIMQNSYNMKYFDDHMQDQSYMRNKKYTYNTSSQNQQRKPSKNIFEDQQVLQSQNYEQSDDLDPSHSNQSSPNIFPVKQIVKVSTELQKIQEQSSPLFKLQFPKKVQYATDQHLKQMPSKINAEDQMGSPKKQNAQKNFNYGQRKPTDMGYSFKYDQNEQNEQQEDQMKQIDFIKKDKKNQSVNNVNQQDNRDRLASKFSKSAGSNPQNNLVDNQIDESDDEEIEMSEDDESQLNEEDEMIYKSEMEKLKAGIVAIKCSVDGWKSHEKKLFLGQGQQQFCYQDTSSRKIQKFSLSDISQIIYPSYGPGIKRHYDQDKIDRSKCMVVKLKPCKSTKNRHKDLQFISDNANEIKQFANNLIKFKDKHQKRTKIQEKNQEKSEGKNPSDASP